MSRRWSIACMVLDMLERWLLNGSRRVIGWQRKRSNIGQLLRRSTRGRNKTDLHKILTVVIRLLYFRWLPRFPSLLTLQSNPLPVLPTRQPNLPFPLDYNNSNNVESHQGELPHQIKWLFHHLSLLRAWRVSCQQHHKLQPKSNHALMQEIWYVDKKLPQYCIIDTSNLRNYPKVFNRVGFYCWH